MEIRISPTPVITEINGARARLWKGETDNGVECHVYVIGIAVAEGQDHAAFERELATIPPPAESVVPLYLITPAREVGQ